MGETRGGKNARYDFKISIMALASLRLEGPRRPFT